MSSQLVPKQDKRGVSCGVTVAAVTVALVSAFLYALASATQQQAASAVPEDVKGVRLVPRLIRVPAWWAGFIGDTGGFIAQGIALALGSLVLVQPLLVSVLLFALPLGAWFGHRRVTRANWAWAALLTVALAVFVIVANPTEGIDVAPDKDWLVVATIVGPIVAVCLLGAAVTRGTTRSLLLAVATGVCYGVTAALLKTVMSLLGDGVFEVFTHWQTFALAATATAGTYLQQAAFQAGALEASLPAVTVLEPVVAVALGVTIMQEELRANDADWLVIGIAVLAMAAGTVALARAAAALEPTPSGRR
jgi:drug/metabolite transporter (DMT)-like permease